MVKKTNINNILFWICVAFLISFVVCIMLIPVGMYLSKQQPTSQPISQPLQQQINTPTQPISQPISQPTPTQPTRTQAQSTQPQAQSNEESIIEIVI